MKVYLDDLRPCSEGWVLARTAREAIAHLEAGAVTHLSLDHDHDLGDDAAAGTGYDVVVWIEEAVALRNFTPPEITLHTANAVGRQRMAAGVQSIRRLAAAHLGSTGVRIVAVTGIRDLAVESEPVVEGAIGTEIALGIDELRFGGAIGVDSVALRSAWRHRPDRVPVLRVFVPATVSDQPSAARQCIRRYADAVVELGLPAGPAWAFTQRNEAMVRGAHRLVAFTDGRETGGTASTIQHATEQGLVVVTVAVQARRK